MAIVGAGRAAFSLVPAFVAAGYPIAAVASRSVDSAVRLAALAPGAEPVPVAGIAHLADIVILSVPDGAIATAAAEVRWEPGVAAVHIAGSVGLEPLAAASAAGAQIGAWHPLQSLTGQAQSFGAIAVAIEADEPLAGQLRALAAAIGARPFALPAAGRALYHLSAALASNYVVALVSLAASLWQEFGVDRETAVAALAPLVAGTAGNLAAVGLPQALTGPIARGDVTTIDRHLAALQAARPDLVPLYRDLGRAALALAVERGLPAERAAEITNYFCSSGTELPTRALIDRAGLGVGPEFAEHPALRGHSDGRASTTKEVV